MQCKRCGAELKPGRMYCSSCGKEVQMVSGYSDLEDEYLRHILKESSENATAEPQSREQVRESTGPLHKKKKNNKIPIIVVSVLLTVFILTAAGIKLYVNYQNDHSYEYQLAKANEYMAAGKYGTALEYYQNALVLVPQDVTARLAMAKIYMEQREYDYATVLYTEVLKLEQTNYEAYQNLIAIYEQKQDYESIIVLAKGVTDERLLPLFANYIVEPPVISPVADTYDDFINVGIYSLEEEEIYYTLDGSDPTGDNAILYTEEDGIPLEKNGTYTVKAVCKNEKGINSSVAESVFVIKLRAPGYAKVVPDGGRIDQETQVVITAEPGCSIYYTWDGTQPDKNSPKYLSPLDIPSGNNILSVLVVNNKTGLDSGVYRANFIYYP